MPLVAAACVAQSTLQAVQLLLEAPSMIVKNGMICDGVASLLVQSVLGTDELFAFFQLSFQEKYALDIISSSSIKCIIYMHNHTHTCTVVCGCRGGWDDPEGGSILDES